MDSSKAFAAVDAVAQRGNPVPLTGVAYDSRQVQPGDLFVAMRGESTDGNRYIDAALERGAAAIVTDSREAFDLLATQHPDHPCGSGRARPPRARPRKRRDPRPSRAPPRAHRRHRHQRQDDDSLPARSAAAQRGPHLRAARHHRVPRRQRGPSLAAHHAGVARRARGLRRRRRAPAPPRR